MTKKNDPLIGEPLTEEEEAFYARLADRAEAYELTPAASGLALEGDEAAAAGRDLLESIIGGVELEQAINVGGRPALDGPAGTGASPVRRFRLPRDLDEALLHQADIEDRKPSVIMREALREYLDKQAS